MNCSQFDILTNALLNDCRDLLDTKGDDYSTNTDRLSHFKTVSDLCKKSKYDVWLVLFSKHVVAITNYINKRDFEGSAEEDIHSRIKDAINYLVLLQALISEDKLDEAVNKIESKFTKKTKTKKKLSRALLDPTSSKKK